MLANISKKSFYYRIKDKWQRRNKGNFFLLIKNFYYYFKFKFFLNKKFKRGHLIAQINKNSVIAEIGVWKGDFSKKILDYCEPKKLFLIDPWVFDDKIKGCAPQVEGIEPLEQSFFDEAYNETKSKFKNNSKIEILKTNSLEASKYFEEDYFDYIYIDAEHSYDAVMKDLSYWYPKLKRNGYIFGDDYHWRGDDYTLCVERAYQDFFKLKKIKYWCVFKSQVVFKKP